MNKFLKEEDKIQIQVDAETLKDPTKSKELTDLTKSNPNLELGVGGEDKSETKSDGGSKSMASMMEQQEEATIEPKDKATIKYLSNVIDSNSGEVSKPFTIADKRYQMVRGMSPDKKVVLGVYCFDEVDGDGNNVIHPSDYFEKTIALPMKEKLEMGDEIVEGGYDFNDADREFNDKESLMNFLNLSDIEPIYKHFFVNIKTGKISAKFKTTREMIKSGVKLGPDEDYMDAKTLKKFRFGEYFKNDIKEEEVTDDNRNIDKLKSDVKKLATLIKNKFSGYLSKLDKPIEQAQFLSAMAEEIGVPLSKLSSIINTYKDINKGEVKQDLTSEVKVIKKQELEESLKRTPKIIKVKDFKNG